MKKYLALALIFTVLATMFNGVVLAEEVVEVNGVYYQLTGNKWTDLTQAAKGIKSGYTIVYYDGYYWEATRTVEPVETTTNTENDEPNEDDEDEQLGDPQGSDEGENVDLGRHEPNGRIDDDDIVFETGIMTAKLEGAKPKIEFYYTQDYENETRFKVNFEDLIEYEDVNDNGVFDEETDEETLGLGNAEWTHTSFYNLTDPHTEEWIGIGINITATGLFGELENTTVKFRLSMYAYDVTVDSYTITGGTELKIDVIVDNWPFQAEENGLALEVEIEKEIEGIATVEYEYEGGLEENGFYIVNQTGTIFGYFRWVNQSTVTSPDGKTSIVDVTAAYQVEELEIEEEEVEQKLAVYLCYPNFNGTLEHDPSVGLNAEQAPPGPPEGPPETPETPPTQPEGAIPSRNGLDFMIETEVFTVKFAGSIEVPKFQYWYNTTTENRTVYQVFFHQLFEFNDKNSDGNFTENVDKMERMLALPSADIALEGPETIEDGIRFNFTIEEEPGIKATLQCSLYDTTQTITGADDTTYTITGKAELKIDVIIERWPFKNDDNPLCLRWSFNPETPQKETIEPTITDSTVTYGGGYFKWITSATVYSDTIDSWTVLVNSSFQVKENKLNIYMVYPNFENNILVHDPSLGVMLDTAPPTLIILQTPTINIAPADPVTITADAIDAVSGIESVLLFYSTDDGATWLSEEITLSEDKYATSIPAQTEGTTVKYFVLATDFAGNQKVSDITTYAIIAPGLDSWTLYGAAITTIVIAAAAYYTTRKRKQPNIPIPE